MTVDESRQPVPAAKYSQELLLTFSGDEYYDFIASRGNKLRPRFARSLALADIKAGIRVLDIGCGRGEVVLHAAKRGAKAVGVDYSADCLDLTTQTLQLGSEATRARVTLVCADAVDLPFEDKVFDRALMLDIVEHLHPWQLRLALAEARRVLADDGYLIIHTLPNRWALRYGFPLLRLLRPELPRSPRSDYEREVHVNEQDLVTLKRSLDEVGFTSEIWLENLTVNQAIWQGEGRKFADIRRDVYPILSHPFLRVASSVLMHTPLRLIIANDIFAIAWCRDGERPQILGGKGFSGWVEEMAVRLSGKL